MSSRFYPIHQIGNPQLRVFLPNFWMKLVKPSEKQPPNVVQFRVPLAMTDYDIRNYLEKIYKVEVMHISSEMTDGKCVPCKKGYIVKEEDYRKVIVTLPRNKQFIFPDIISTEIKSEQAKHEERSKQGMESAFSSFTQNNKNRFGLPPWFNY